MKKILLLLVVLMLGVTAPSYGYNIYAPNSFEVVSVKSWDYKTVEQLLFEGKSPRYHKEDLGNNITRYELAKIIQNLLENDKDPADEEKLAKLRDRFARELSALGVETEKKPRRIEISGDARIRKGSGNITDARVRTETRWDIGNNTNLVVGGSAEKNI